MEIPKYIVDLANKINESSKKQKRYEAELIKWLESKGFNEDDYGDSDIIANLSYGEYEDIESFVVNLKNAMEDNDWNRVYK